MAGNEGKKRSMSLKRKIFFSTVITLVLAVLIIEVVFRVFDLRSIGFNRHYLTLDYEKEARVIGHPYLGFMLKPKFRRDNIRHNALGFRGPEISLKQPENTFRIACIGGSSTYGHGPSAESMTWPALLENTLRRVYPAVPIQVINCGTSGYSTFENMNNLSLRIVDLEPDLLIIYQSINDMHCGVKRGKYLRDNRHWRAVFHVPEKSGLERLLEHSMTFLVYRWRFTDYMDMGDLAASTIVDFKAGYMAKKIHPEELDCFQRNLRVMIAVAREFGAEVLLSTQACFVEHLTNESERKGMALHAAVLTRLAGEKKTYFIDNASFDLMPQDETLFTKNVHLTDRGTRRLSENFARYIVKEKIIDRRMGLQR